MLSGANLMDLPMRSRDGIAGSCHDLLFDDRLHTVRFIVVDTGRWLPGRKVLVSPFAVRPERNDVACDLSKAAIHDSPSIDDAPPVSRRLRAGSEEPATRPVDAGPTVSGPSIVAQARDAIAAMRERSSLRSAREVLGYDVASPDAHLGRVADLLFDPDAWRMRTVVVDRGWPIALKRQAVPFDAIDRISARRARVTVDAAPAA